MTTETETERDAGALRYAGAFEAGVPLPEPKRERSPVV